MYYMARIMKLWTFLCKVIESNTIYGLINHVFYKYDKAFENLLALCYAYEDNKILYNLAQYNQSKNFK